jgi:DNA-binding HxlR family transcriptional regulator
MTKYGQFCPVARLLEIIGDRWTLLIIRDMLTGTKHFNDLERGLPGISRALLADRMKLLQRAGVIEKCINGSGRNATEYHLTQAGQELLSVIMSLKMWGETWAFSDPIAEELDPVLLMWWLRGQANVELLPESRIVVQFDFPEARNVTFWLILTREDVSLCLTDPGYEINLLVSSDLATFYKVEGRRITYQQALDAGTIRVEGSRSHVRAFPTWFSLDNTKSFEPIEVANAVPVFGQ